MIAKAEARRKKNIKKILLADKTDKTTVTPTDSKHVEVGVADELSASSLDSSAALEKPTLAAKRRAARE